MSNLGKSPPRGCCSDRENGLLPVAVARRSAAGRKGKTMFRERSKALAAFALLCRVVWHWRQPGRFLVFVSSGDTDSVLAYDGVTGAFQGTFASGGGLDEPEGIAFGPDGNFYVSSRSNEVLRYDGQTGAFIDVFASGNGLADPAGIAFGGPDNDLFVSSGIPDEGRRQPDPPLRRRHRRLQGRRRSGQRGGARRPRRHDLRPRRPALCQQHARRRTRQGPSLRPRHQRLRRHVRRRRLPAATLQDPTDLVFGPDGDLFVSSAATSEVKRYDGTTGAFEGNFVTAGLGGLEEAEGVVFGPNGNLFVVSELGNAVLEYDGTTGAFVGEFVTEPAAAAWPSRPSSPSDPPPSRCRRRRGAACSPWADWPPREPGQCARGQLQT